MNISTKLTVLMAILLAGGVLTAALDLHEIQAMANGARIVHLVDMVRASAQRIDPAASGAREMEAVREIDGILDGLLEGDPRREAPRVRTEPLRRELLAARDHWKRLKEEVQGGREIARDFGPLFRLRDGFLAQSRRVGEMAMAVSRAREERHRLMVGVSAILLILLIVGAWRVVQRDIAKPVAHLAEKARQVSRGDLQVQFTIGEEDELDLLAHCLDAMVSGLKDRIRELSEAKAAAETASQAKSEFLSRMGHELRTPLHAILGYTDLVLDGVEGPINPDQHSSLSRVCDQGHHLLKLIDRLLAYARLHTQGISARSEPFDLSAVLRRLSHFATLSERKGVNFSLRVSPLVPEWLGGDEAGLFEVLEGLVENAVKFTHEGEVALQVERESEAGETVCLRFTVRDTGIGIPAELQADIFHAFHQTEGASTRRHAGVGLGLTTASLWARLIGGRLWVESEPARGSTFHFEAPFAKYGGPGDHPEYPPASVLSD